MALPVRKAYAGAPVSTTLSALLASGSTSCTVASVTGWPTTFPFFAVIEPGTSREEKVKVTAISGTTLTITRHEDDTNAVEHASASTVYPVFTALEANEANQIASAMTTKGDIITTDGTTINRLAVGGTNTHVLQVDSSQTNGIKWGQVATAGIADSAVTSAKIADGTIVNDDINASAAIALSKLATGALPTAITVASANIVDGTIATGDIGDSSITLAKLTAAVQAALNPAGAIQAYGGSSAPTGYLLCDGAAISRTTYADLYTAIGTTYGSGNGSTTFNVPNLKGKIPVGLDAAQTEFDALAETGGAKTHTLTTTQIPSHQHNVSAYSHSGISTADLAHTHGSGTLATANATTGITASTNPTGSHQHNLNYSGRAGSTTTGYAIIDGTGWTGTLIKSAEAGDHSHTVTINDSGHSHTVSGSTGAMSANGTHTHTISNHDAKNTDATGGDGSHNNLQPYIVVNYIIKT